MYFKKNAKKMFKKLLVLKKFVSLHPRKVEFSEVYKINRIVRCLQFSS